MQHTPEKRQIASLGPQILKAGIWLTILQLCIFFFTCLFLDEISWIIGYQKPPVFHTTQLFMQLLCTKYGFSLLLDLGINCLFSTYQLFNDPETFDTFSSKALIVFNILFIISILLQTQTILGKHIYIISNFILLYMKLIVEDYELFFGLGSIAWYYLTPTYANEEHFPNASMLKQCVFMLLELIGWIMIMVLVFLMIFPVALNTALASHINAILVRCLASYLASLPLIHGLFDYRPLLYIILFPIGGSSLWFCMERVWGVCFFSLKNAHILYSRYKNRNLKANNAP